MFLLCITKFTWTGVPYQLTGDCVHYNTILCSKSNYLLFILSLYSNQGMLGTRRHIRREVHTARGAHRKPTRTT